MPDDTTDGSSTPGIFQSLLADAFQYGTPLVQSVLTSGATPAQVQAQRMRDAVLNGSGPNDPTLAQQSPQGILDFIRGSRVTGAGDGTDTRSSGLNAGGMNWTVIGLAIAAIVAIIFIMKK